MKETLKHKEAFEYFYSLGAKASDKNVSKVAGECQVSPRTIWRWYKIFNWQERVEQRDIENAKRLEEKTNTVVVATKANYRKEIKSSLSIIKVGEIYRKAS